MKRWLPLAVFASLALIAVCAQDKAAPAGDPQSRDMGIGPVKELKLGPLDAKMAARGKELFDARCAACHGLDRAMTGPALGSILKDETPEFVMNMILNTAEMVAKDQKIKKLMAQYGLPMPALGLSETQARDIVEYLRTTGR